jgi:hypothetical protein
VSRLTQPQKKQQQLLLQLKHCGQRLDQQLSVNHRTQPGALVVAGGMTLLSLDAHDLAFSFLGSWQ